MSLEHLVNHKTSNSLLRGEYPYNLLLMLSKLFDSRHACMPIKKKDRSALPKNSQVDLKMYTECTRSIPANSKYTYGTLCEEVTYVIVELWPPPSVSHKASLDLRGHVVQDREVLQVLPSLEGQGCFYPEGPGPSKPNPMQGRGKLRLYSRRGGAWGAAFLQDFTAHQRSMYSLKVRNTKIEETIGHRPQRP